VIGGKEVPNYAKLTWVKRDELHEKSPAVKERFLAHLEAHSIN